MKYLFWPVIVCIIAVAIFFITIDVWLYYPYKTLEIHNPDPEAIILEENIVKPGEALSYILDYCKYSDTDSVVHRKMLDGQVITLEDRPGGLPLGCHKVRLNNALVPATLNPGQYRMDIIVEYKVNPIRKIKTHYTTELFTVIPRAHNDPYKEIIPSSQQVQILDK